MDPFEAIPLELQQLIFSNVSFQYFYVSLVSKRWHKLFWQTRTSIVLHKDSKFNYKSKFTDQSQFDAFMKKIRPELIQKVAQLNDPILILNLDKFPNLTSFSEHYGDCPSYRDDDWDIRHYSSLQNLPKLRRLDLNFQDEFAQRIRETILCPIIAGCTALETLRLAAESNARAQDLSIYLTALTRLQALEWLDGLVEVKDLARSGMQLTKLAVMVDDTNNQDGIDHLTVFSNMKSLKIHGGGRRTAAPLGVLSVLTALEELCINGVSYAGLNGDLMKLTAMSNLRQLSLSWVTDPQHGPQLDIDWVVTLPSIQSLTLRDHQKFPDNLTRCTGLTELHIGLKHVDVLNKVMELTQLESLDIDAEDIEAMCDVLKGQLTRFTRLKKIVLSNKGCPNEFVTMPCWSQLTGLTDVTLNHLGDVEDEEVLSLIHALPNLKKLGLWGYRVDDFNLEDMHHQNIKRIWTLSEDRRFWFQQHTKHIQDSVYWRYYDTTN